MRGFGIKFKPMGDTPIYKRPWFFIFFWLSVLVIAYLWEIVRAGGFQLNQVRILFDALCLFPILLLMWMAFFSQFVLPLTKTGDRWRIFTRVLSRLVGVKGPAIFIKNGKQEKEPGEEDRKGKGVLWLDSASAAVTRTETKIQRTLGPGFHFIGKKETIAGTVDLHIQNHAVGLNGQEKPFAEKTETQSDEEYKQIQDRRAQVSAWTRDGIEIVPNISVTFRIDTGFPEEGQPGSRFGYRSGVTPKDKKNEKADQESIRRAVLGESINPNYNPESPRYRVAWNQLPAMLAVDIWREYASKFTLSQFFEPCVEMPPPYEAPVAPTEEEIDPLTRAIQMKSGRESFQIALARILRVANHIIARSIAWLEKRPPSSSTKHPPIPPPQPPSPETKTVKKTALQAINEMVKARLTQEFVEHLDQHGVWVEGHVPELSREFQRLQGRGLKVISVSINNPRLRDTVDQAIIGKWQAGWLKYAKDEQNRINKRRELHETAAQDRAIQEYGVWLGEGIMQAPPPDMKNTLKALLKRTRSMIIRSDGIRRKMATELQYLEDILRWIEVNGR